MRSSQNRRRRHRTPVRTGPHRQALTSLTFVLEVNILGLGFAAVGLLAAAVVVLPFALGAAAWEAADRTSFKRWGPVVGLILALLALLFLPA